jgi:hypothetical protein
MEEHNFHIFFASFLRISIENKVEYKSEKQELGGCLMIAFVI